MDEFSFHPYPKSDRDPMLKGYRWPNAGVPNLPRLKQAFWDAFKGTPQPLFAEGGRSGGLKFRLDEVGWQVRVLSSAEHAYEGTENIQPIDEESQARIYGELIRFLGCEPSVSSLLFFGLIDESDLDRWQAGLIRADGTLRPAYGAVKTTFAQTQGRCAGKQHPWRHTESVLGARAKFPAMGRFLPVKHRYWAFNATAEESARFQAGVFRAGPRRAIARQLARGGGLLRQSGLLNAYWTPLIKFPGRPLPRGRYVFAVRLAAEMNPDRTATFVGKRFESATRLSTRDLQSSGARRRGAPRLLVNQPRVRACSSSLTAADRQRGFARDKAAGRRGSSEDDLPLQLNRAPDLGDGRGLNPPPDEHRPAASKRVLRTLRRRD
jgi:hypothetical protein